MKKLLLLMILTFAALSLSAQSETELNQRKAELESEIDKLSGNVGDLQSELDGINSELEILGGWHKGFSGIAGFNLNKANNWQGNANPNSRSVGLSLNGNAFANKVGENAFWRNSFLGNVAWSQVRTGEEDENGDPEGTDFDRVTDLLNLSSLAGKNLSKTLALSGLGELYSSFGNFLSPGTLDLGVGFTFVGIPNTVLVIHPANLHIGFPADGSPYGTKAFFGAKLKAEYVNEFDSGILFNSTFSSFIPYSGSYVNDVDPTMSETARNYTWLNQITFPVYKGVGLGVGFGFRHAAFEYDGTQTYYNVGLSYDFVK